MNSGEVNKSILLLLRILQRRTVTGESVWEMPLPGEGDRVSLSTSTSSFTLSSKDLDGAAPFIFQAYDSAGRTVFTVDTAGGNYSDAVADRIQELWDTIHSTEGPILGFINRVIEELDPPF